MMDSRMDALTALSLEDELVERPPQTLAGVAGSLGRIVSEFMQEEARRQWTQVVRPRIIKAQSRQPQMPLAIAVVDQLTAFNGTVDEILNRLKPLAQDQLTKGNLARWYRGLGESVMPSPTLIDSSPAFR